jgi:putative membrane protein
MLKLEMAYIVIVAVYGSLTAARKIILVQGLPALLALIALALHI